MPLEHEHDCLWAVHNSEMSTAPPPPRLPDGPPYGSRTTFQVAGSIRFSPIPSKGTTIARNIRVNKLVGPRWCGGSSQSLNVDVLLAACTGTLFQMQDQINTSHCTELYGGQLHFPSCSTSSIWSLNIESIGLQARNVFPTSCACYSCFPPSQEHWLN